MSRVEGRLTLLNSMLGELYWGSYCMLTKVNGFARGLDWDGKYFFIGVTEHRYPEKLKNISNNIGLDTGVHLFDPNSFLNRFIRLPNAEAIHSVLVE